MKRRFLGIAFALVAWSTHAAAQTPENQAAGLQKFDEGRAALEAGNYAAALAAFEASNQLLASPNSLLYMARCYKALGKTASAFTTYRLAVRQAQDRLVATADKRYTATRDFATLEAAEIEPTVPKLALRMMTASVPAGTRVTVNGVEAPPSTWGTAVDTDPGPIVVEASGPRLKPFRAQLDLRASETERVDIVLDRVPTATLHLRFRVRPSGMTVREDDQPLVEPEASAARELDPGAHEVVVSATGYRDFRWRGELADRQVLDVDVLLVRDPARAQKGTAPWLFFTAGGAAIVATGIASVFALHANAVSKDEQAKIEWARDPSKKDEIRSQSTIANVFFVSGAVLAAGAGVLAFTTTWRRTQPPVVVGVAGSGLAAMGRF